MSLTRIYDIAINEWSDPRLRDSIWVDTPFPVLGAVFCYVYFVKVCGPKFMKNRQPYELKGVISIYNFIQVLWNTCIAYKAIRIALHLPLSELACLPAHPESEYVDFLMTSVTKLYYYNKIFDFLDTVFFVLRKKFNQVSFLHLYHHISVAILLWMFTKYSPSGNANFASFFNAVVHIVMYIYYQISLMKLGDMTKMKKYITQLQMVQLFTIGVHNSLVLFRNPCKNVVILNALLVFEVFYLFALFAAFYYNTYWKKSKKK